jgi:heme exporter protein A
MLTLNNIDVSFDGDKILSPVSFTLFESCCLNIHGANGTGKTSLLKSILGLNGINTGMLIYNKQDVSNHSDEYRLMTEYIGHNIGLNDNFSVAENLSLWTDLYGTEMMLASALYTMQLEAQVDKKVKTLSAGTKKRVALSKLLLSDSPIWFLDEPFANLDSSFKDIMLNMMRARCEQKGIVIFTSHTPMNENFITNFDIKDYVL